MTTRPTTTASHKRPRSRTPPPPHKRQKTADATESSENAALPADFFAPTSTAEADPDLAALDEEWARFEAEVVTAPAPSLAAHTIVAAPLSAEEIAAAAEPEVQEEDTKDGDAEDEQERLMEEFDEMMGLEERVRRLKERREALRQKETEGSRLEIRNDPRGRGKEEDDEDGSSDVEEDEDEEEDFFTRGR